MSRRQTSIPSTTLDHHPARRARQQEPSEAEQDERPEELQRKSPGEREAVALAEPHVDRRLDDGRERERVTDLAQQLREEAERDRHSGEEDDDRGRERHD